MTNYDKGTGPRAASAEPQPAAVDPCASEREQFRVIQHDIVQLQADIDSGDFDFAALERMKAQLAEKKRRRPELELALTKCVAQHPPAAPQ